MRILSRYLLARFGLIFAATFAAAASIVVVVELLLNLDRMAEFQPGAAEAATTLDLRGIALYLALRLPSEYLSYLIPISGFVAGFACLGIGAHWRETLAMRAGGLPLRAACGPLLGAGAALTLAALIAAEAIVVPTTRSWLAVRHGPDPIDLSGDSFWTHHGARIYNVEEADPQARRLRGVQIFERSANGRLARSIHAPTADVSKPERWILEQATVRTFAERAEDEAPTTTHHERLELNVRSDEDAALYADNLRGASLARLSAWIARREARGSDTSAARTTLHTRLAGAAAAFVLVCFALPFGLRVERGAGIGRPAVYASVGVIVYYALSSLCAVASAQGVLAPALGAWLPPVMFAVLGAIGLARATRPSH